METFRNSNWKHFCQRPCIAFSLDAFIWYILITHTSHNIHEIFSLKFLLLKRIKYLFNPFDLPAEIMNETKDSVWGWHYFLCGLMNEFMSPSQFSFIKKKIKLALGKHWMKHINRSKRFCFLKQMSDTVKWFILLLQLERMFYISNILQWTELLGSCTQRN